MAVKHFRWLLLPLAVAAGLFFLLEKNFLPGASPQSTPQESLRLLNGIMRLIQQDYVEEPDPLKTMTGAFKGMVNSLDVLSAYLDSAAVEKYRKRERLDLYETGVIIYKRQGAFPVVLGIKENSPAATSGLQLGDYLYTLDELTTLNLSMLEIDLYLKHEGSQPVSIKTTRNAKNITLEIPRARLFEEAYSFSSQENLGGILKIQAFQAPLTESITRSLIPRLAGTKDPLVLDLRNCSGGDLEEAQRFLNVFVQNPNLGRWVNKAGEGEILACPEAAPLEEVPLVVWINQATLGSAELVAHVLQAHRDCRLIGHKTLGLVAQRKFFPLSDGSGLVLTSAVFRPADNSTLWEEGVTPDVELKADIQSGEAYLDETLRQITSR